MGYLYLGLVALLFSFGGTCVKLIQPYFTPSMITFLRFLVGVFWLLGLKLALRQRFRGVFAAALKSKWGWLLFGAAVKYLAYITENTALSAGVSYGNILTRPVQIILHTVLGVFVLRDSVSPEAFLPGLALDGSHIAADRSLATNVPGVFAAGDCVGTPYQIAKAVGDGNVAALSAVKYVDRLLKEKEK